MLLNNKLQQIINEYKEIIDTLLPDEFPISCICKKTGMSRQGVRAKLITNYEPGDDFYKRGNAIYISKRVTFQLLKIGGND